MELLLIRHLESVKNVLNRFSSREDADPLTQRGIDGSDLLGKSIARFIENGNHVARAVYSAQSERAESTATSIARRIGVPTKSFQALRSIRVAYPGVSEDDVAELNPEFMSQIALYRLGLYNSYDIVLPDGCEACGDFEKRVMAAIYELISIPEESLKIIVLHRSAITATLFHFARKHYLYPEDFYGYIPLDLGHVSWLERIDDSKWIIKAVNVTSDKLLTSGRISDDANGLVR